MGFDFVTFIEERKSLVFVEDDDVFFVLRERRLLAGNGCTSSVGRDWRQ